MKLLFPALIAALTFGGAAYAEDAAPIPAEHITVLACLENLEVSTTWGQCLGAMFGPCADAEVGTEDHAMCLEKERDGWVETKQNLETQTMAAITPVVATDLVEILDGWGKYVSQKCSEAAMSKSGSNAESAELGCQVAELAGLSGEFAACLEGRSTAEYCQLVDK